MDELFDVFDDSPNFREEILKGYLDRRYLVLNSIVNDKILEDITLQILEFNRQDKDIPVEKRKPIWLFIQTSGGAVFAGLNLIDTIKASITPVYTVCFSLCASMGFHLLIAGHKRYAFKNSVLLMHDGQIEISNTSSKAIDTMNFFSSLENRIKQQVLDCTKITPEYYDSVYEKEYYIYANDQGKELGCIDYIIGEDVSLDEIL